MGLENNPIDSLRLEVETLKRTKQNNIPAGGNSMILTRGNMDGETSVLHRKDVINEDGANMYNIPSEVAVSKFVSDKLHTQSQQFKGALNKVTCDIKSLIDSETTRAKIAETELNTKIQVINIDGIKQMIIEETNRATAIEQRLREKIKDEKERATEAENTINTSLDAEVNRASTKEGELQHAINDESIRAKDAEKNLSDRIDSSDVALVETKNSISTETNRAKCAEKTLDSKIDTAVQTTNNSVNQIRIDLGAEIQRASAAEATASAAIAAEVTRAKAEEHRLEMLMKGIDYDEEFQKLKEHVSVTEGVLGKRIDDEINRATNAESKLQKDINAEIERASRADEKAISEINMLRKTLGEEIERSTSRDDDLNGRLSTEITRATTTEDNLYKAIAEVSDKANDTDKETVKKLAEFNERLTSSIKALNEEDSRLSNALTAEKDRATKAEISISSSIASETIRAKDAEDDLHHMIIDEIERSTAEDKRIEMVHNQSIEDLKAADTSIVNSIEAEIERATKVEKELAESIKNGDADKVDKSVAGEDGLIVKDLEFSFADSDHCDKNAKQIEFHKTLLNIMTGKTTDTKEVYDLSIISGAHDIGLALEAEKKRAMSAEQHLHDLIDRGISDNAVGKDVYASNQYRTVSSHEFNTDPSIFNSMFWTKTVTKDVRDPKVERVKEHHFVSSDIDVDITRVTDDASIINLRVDKATEAEVSAMIKSVFGV